MDIRSAAAARNASRWTRGSSFRQSCRPTWLDEALTLLAITDPRKSQVVELRFFGGMSVDETAEALQVSAVTVMRDWRFAKLWLFRAMSAR